MTDTQITCQCCVAGGGPAGLMLGYLLARVGVDVIVLEKHADFLRDFRGDTIHPSTLENMVELGLDERFLELQHQKMSEAFAHVGSVQVKMIDFSHLPVKHPFIALMPQWDFLNFLSQEAAAYSGFRLMMSAQAEDLIIDGDRVVGLRGVHNGKPFEIRAKLTVAADGRSSRMRERAGLNVTDLGAPIDVLWFKLERRESDDTAPGGQLRPGQFVIRLNRGSYWQCAYAIPKGEFETLKSEGIKSFRSRLADALDFEPQRFDTLKSWDDISLLTVKVDRLDTWFRDGFLAIGDAAHAMSPVGGVGVNLAIQDAVATANILHRSLRPDSRISTTQLAQVQRRRSWPARFIQRIQVSAHKNLIKAALEAKPADKDFLPTPVRLVQRFPILARLPARIFGMGVRLEHVADSILDHPAVKS